MPSCGQASAPQCGGTCSVNENCQQSAANGNQCVCCPGIIINTVEGVRWSSKSVIIWDPYIPPCPVWYNVYAITALRLSDADHDGVADDSGGCFLAHLPTAEATDNSTPPVGMTRFYQFASSNENGPGPLGYASNGMGRLPPTQTCP